MLTKTHLAIVSNAFRENALLKILLVLVLLSNVHTGYKATKAVEFQKTVLIPVGLNEKIEIEGDTISETYLLTVSRFIFDLALDYTKYTVKSQYHLIMAWMSPRSYKKYQPVFNAFIDDAQIGDVVSCFFIDKIEHNPGRKIVKVSGKKTMIYDGTEVETKNETYAIKYSTKAGRLMIEEIGEWKTVEEAQE